MKINNNSSMYLHIIDTSNRENISFYEAIYKSNLLNSNKVVFRLKTFDYLK